MRRFLFISWLLILFHTIKDIFQDFLGTEFLYFLDANEDLSFSFLSKWGLPSEALVKEGLPSVVV